MPGIEHGRQLNASPEDFSSGREAFYAFSKNFRPDKDPREEFDLNQIINDRSERLLDAVDNQEEHNEGDGYEEAKEKVWGNILKEIESDNEVQIDKQKQGSWEPFSNEPHPSQRFINRYGGPLYDQLELHRANAERLIQVAGIEGNIILTDKPRDRGAGGATITSISPDGSTTAGRFKAAEKQKTVKSTPEGWRIEIPGQEMIDELSREQAGEALNNKFTEKFNQNLRDSIRDIVFTEKLQKDLFPRSIVSIVPYVGAYAINELSFHDPSWTIGIYGLIFQCFMNAPDVIRGRTYKKFRNRKNILEIVFPDIELDHLIRGIAYMKGKGRNLVRLRKEKTLRQDK